MTLEEAQAAHAAAVSTLESARQAHSTARAAFDAAGREPVPARPPIPPNPGGGPRLVRMQQGGSTRAVLPKDFSVEQRRLYGEFLAARATLESAQAVEAEAARVLREAEAELASAEASAVNPRARAEPS